MISEALPGPRLLLVDDDETFCGVLGEALEKRGFAVSVAHNVPDARRLAEAEAPRYAVVDLRMPGPSGLELVSALCQADGAAKVVVLTGFASITTPARDAKTPRNSARADERPDNAPVPGRAPVRLTPHEPRSTVPLEENVRLKYLCSFPVQGGRLVEGFIGSARRLARI